MPESSQIRVVIVDDEPLAREMLREMLQSDPQVTIVGESSNGREALDVSNCTAPDLLFLDIQMSELGGVEVLQNLG